MKLKSLKDIDVEGKRVLVRADLDYKDKISGSKRQEVLLPTLDYLAGKATKIVLLGHRGRPAGKVDRSLSLKSASDKLKDFLKKKWGDKKAKNLNMYVMENLRFNPGEYLDYARDKEAKKFAEHLASLGDVYINEAFATSHRNHVSIVGLPRLLPHAAGFHFVKEIDSLSRVLENPKRPLLAIISGVKEDKLEYIELFKKFCDLILVGGRLPALIQDSIHSTSSGLSLTLRSSTLRLGLEELRPEGMLSNAEASKFPGLDKRSRVPSGTRRSGAGKVQNDNSKIKIAKLTADLSDIEESSIRLFEEEISYARTIVVSGPMGKFEDERHRQGTERILRAIAKSGAFKVAGGGDTERAISLFGLTDKFDWISVGGGSMLEFLAKGTLPGIEALLN